MEGPPSEDLAITVLTCKGDLTDPSFPIILHQLVCKLETLLSGKKPFLVTKVEPWNSVRVTFNIPREAAHRLRLLAERGDTSLRELGILSVQIEGDQVITLTLASGFADKQNLILSKSTNEGTPSTRDTPLVTSNSCKLSSLALPCATLSCNNLGTVPVDSSGSSNSNTTNPTNVDTCGSNAANSSIDSLTKNAQYLSQSNAAVGSTIIETKCGTATFKSPNVIAPQSGEPLPFITSNPSSSSSSLSSSSTPNTTSANIIRNVQGSRQSQPNVGPFPFASMQHAMHTKQGINSTTSTTNNSFNPLQASSSATVSQPSRLPIMSVPQNQGLFVPPVSTQNITSSVTPLLTDESSSSSSSNATVTIDTLNAAFIRNPNLFNNVKNLSTPSTVTKQAQNILMAAASSVAPSARCSNSITTVATASNATSNSSSTINSSSSASSNVALTSPLLVNLLQSDGSGSHLKMMPPPPPPQLQTPPATVTTAGASAAVAGGASCITVNEPAPKRNKQRKPRKVKDKPPDDLSKNNNPPSTVTNFSVTTPPQQANRTHSYPLPSTCVQQIQSGVTTTLTQNQSKQSKSPLGIHSHFMNIPAGNMPRYPSIHPEAQGQPQVVTSGQLTLRHPSQHQHQQQPPRFNHIVGSPPVVVPSSHLQRPNVLTTAPRQLSPTNNNKDIKVKSRLYVDNLQSSNQIRSSPAELVLPIGNPSSESKSLSSPQQDNKNTITTTNMMACTRTIELTGLRSPPSSSSSPSCSITGLSRHESGKTKHLINPFTGHLEPMVSDDEEEDRNSTSAPSLFPELEQTAGQPHGGSCEQIISDSGKDNNNHSDTDSGFGKSTTDASSQSPLEISVLDQVTLAEKAEEVNSPKSSNEKIKIRLKIDPKPDTPETSLLSSRKEQSIRKLSAHSAPELLESSAVTNLIAEPRVPPLHISLRGPNAAVVVSGRRESGEEEVKGTHSEIPTPVARKPRSRGARAMSAESSLIEDSYTHKNQRKKLQREQRFLSGGGIVLNDSISKSVSPTLMQVDVLKSALTFSPSKQITSSQELLCSELSITTTKAPTTAASVGNDMDSSSKSARSFESHPNVRSPNCAQKPPTTEGNISCELNVPLLSSSSDISVESNSSSPEKVPTTIVVVSTTPSNACENAKSSESRELGASKMCNCQAETRQETQPQPASSEINANHSDSLTVEENSISNHLVNNRTLENEDQKHLSEAEATEKMVPNTSIVTIKEISEVIAEESNKLLKNEVEADSQEIPPLIASSEIESNEGFGFHDARDCSDSSGGHVGIGVGEQQRQPEAAEKVENKLDASSHLSLPDSSSAPSQTGQLGHESNDLPSCEESSLDSSTAPTENVSYCESSDEISRDNDVCQPDLNSVTSKDTKSVEHEVGELTALEQKESTILEATGANFGILEDKEATKESNVSESQSVYEDSLGIGIGTPPGSSNGSEQRLSEQVNIMTGVASVAPDDKTQPLQIMITSAVPSLVTTTSVTTSAPASTLLKPTIESGGRILILNRNLNSPSASNVGTSVSGDRLSPAGINTPKAVPIKLLALGPSAGSITVRSAATKLAQIINSSSPSSPLSPNSNLCPISSSITPSGTASPPLRLLVSKVTGPGAVSGSAATVSVAGNSVVLVKSVVVTNPSPSIKLLPTQKSAASLSSSSLLIPLPSTANISSTKQEVITNSTSTSQRIFNKESHQKGLNCEQPEDDNKESAPPVSEEPVVKDRNNNESHEQSSAEEADAPTLEPISLSVPAQDQSVSSSEEPPMPDIISAGIAGTTTSDGGPSDSEESISSNEDKRHSVAAGDHNYTSVKSLLKENDDETEVIIQDQEVDEVKTDTECSLRPSPIEKNSRPNKRKSSENAAELIKAYMGYEDVSRRNIYSAMNCTPSNSVTSITIRSRSESCDSDLGTARNDLSSDINNFSQKAVIKNSKSRKRKLTNDSCTLENSCTSEDEVSVHGSEESKSWKNKTRLRQNKQEGGASGLTRATSSVAKAKKLTNCKETRKDFNNKKPTERKRRARELSNSSPRSSRRTKDHNNIISGDAAIFVVNDGQEGETVEIIDDSEEEILRPAVNHVFDDPSPTVTSTPSSGLSLLSKRKTRTIVSGEPNELASVTSSKRRKINKDGHR